MIDQYGRQITCLRISVTDRCNLRCTYCMPEEGVPLLPHSQILTYEEIERVSRVAASLGIHNLKLTGGEPLVRRHLERLIEKLSSIPGIGDISLTTNGTLLARCAHELFAAGLRRLTVSLDTLDEERFRTLTRGGDLQLVLDGIESARKAGFKPVKVNTVVMRDINHEEVGELARWAVGQGLPIRFIEFMPRGEWQKAPEGLVVRTEETFRRVSALERLVPRSRAHHDTGPVITYSFEKSGGSVGFISPVSEPFCARCNRLRLTADGFIKPCLLGESRISVRELLRGDRSDEDIAALIKRAAAMKPPGHRECRSFSMSEIGG